MAVASKDSVRSLLRVLDTALWSSRDAYLLSLHFHLACWGLRIHLFLPDISLDLLLVCADSGAKALPRLPGLFLPLPRATEARLLLLRLLRLSPFTR